MKLSKLQPRVAAVLALAIAAFVSAPVFADLAGKADAYLTEQAAEYGLPGVSAAISVDGEIVWTGGAGYCDVENQLPADGQIAACVEPWKE